MKVGLYQERKSRRAAASSDDSTRGTRLCVREGLRNIMVGTNRHRKWQIWQRRHAFTRQA